MSSRRRLRILPAALGAFILGASAYAQIPQFISYQGMITDASGGGPVPNGQYDMTFRIYTVPTGGAPIWSETQMGIIVNRGLFNARLGVVTPLTLPFDRQYYLGVQLNVAPEMQPRTAFASSPYAYRAIYADTSVYATFAQMAARSAVSDSAVTVRDGAVTNQKIANGAVTLNKIDTTGATPGQVLTRTATGLTWAAGGSGSGTITGITTGPGSPIGIQNGTGPVTTISILPTSIIEPLMHDDAVSTRVIRDAAVTPRKLDPTGSLPGQALTSTGNGVVWGYPIASAIILPYHATQAASVPLWWMTNTGTGSGVRGDHDATTGTNPGVEGYSNSNDPNASALTGTMVSTTAGPGSAAVRGTNNSTGANSYGVYGTQAGTGAGVFGQSLNGTGVRGDGGTYGVEATTINGIAVFGTATGTVGRAAAFNINNINNTSDVVSGGTTGTGNVYRGITSSAFPGAGDIFSGQASGIGDGIEISQLGTGRAAVFTQNNGASPANVVEASGNGSGNVYRGATTGAGDIFNGTNNGTGDGVDVTTSATGTGWAGRFTNQNSANVSPTLGSSSNGSGPSVQGINTGTGRAADFAINNTLSAANAVNATTNGTGTTVFATNTGSGRSGFFQNTAAANTANVVEATTLGSGHVFQGSSTGSGGGDVFNGSTTGTGDGVDVTVTGSGNGGRFVINNTTSTQNAIFATTNGNGRAGYFVVNSPPGGTANAVEAVSNTSGDLFAGTQSGTGDGVDVTTNATGTGWAGRFTNQNGANTSPTLGATSNGSGASIQGVNTGAGNAASFTVNNAAGAANAVVATTNGTGNVYTGTNGTNGTGDIFNGTNNGGGDGIDITISNTGTGAAGRFTNNNNTNPNPVVTASASGLSNVFQGFTTGAGDLFNGTTAVGSGNGDGVDVTVNGTGRAGSFRITNAGSNITALEASTTGSGLVSTMNNAGSGGGLRIDLNNDLARGLEVDGAPPTGVFPTFTPSPNVRMRSLSGNAVQTYTASVTNGIVTADANGDLIKTDPTAVVGGLAWTILGNNGINESVNFIGTINLADFVVRTNNVERGRWYKTGELGVNYGTAVPTAQLEVVAAGTTNSAARLRNTNAANGANVVEASNVGTGHVINATTTGTGNVINATTANTGDVVNALSSGSGDAVDARNSGTGRAGGFAITNAASGANALEATTNGTGIAIGGLHTGASGNAGNFAITNAANASNAVTGSTLGNGNVFNGVTPGSGNVFNGSSTGSGNVVNATMTGTGRAGSFTISNASNSNTAVEVLTTGTGRGILATISNAANTSNVVEAVSNGSGDLFAGTQTGIGDGVDVSNTGTAGTAGRFTINNVANANAAVIGTTNGTGVAVSGTNTGGATGGGAASFTISSALNTSNAVTATTAGTGNVYRGTSTSSGDIFSGTNTAGTGDGVDISISGTGTGTAARLVSNNLANPSPVVTATASGTGNVYEATTTGAGDLFNGATAAGSGNGDGVDVTVNGTGRAGSFRINNAGSNTTALEVTTVGTGRAALFTNNTTASPTVEITNSNVTATARALVVNGAAGTPNVQMGSLGGNTGIIPPAPTDGLVLANSTGLLRREDPVAVIGSYAWLLTGNTVTSAYNGVTGNFIGTNNTQPMVIATTNTTIAQPIEFFTNNTEQMRLTGAGDLGIGTPAPGARLDVVGGIANPAGRFVNGILNTSNALEVATANLTANAINVTVPALSTGAAIRTAGNIVPNTTALHDLGTSTLRWRSIYVDGLASIHMGQAGNEVDMKYFPALDQMHLDFNGNGTGEVVIADNGQITAGGPAIDPSAALWLNSTTGGLLIPRLTPAQRTALVAPASGLMVWNTATSALNVNTGTPGTPVWAQIVDTTMLSGLAWKLDGNAITAGYNGVTGQFIGTTNGQPLVLATTHASQQDIRFMTGNTERARIVGANGRLGLNTPTPSATLTAVGAGADVAGAFAANNITTVVDVSQSGNGAGLVVASGLGPAGVYTNNSPVNSTLAGVNNGAGNAIQGTAQAGSAGSFQNNSALNSTVNALNLNATGNALTGTVAGGTAVRGIALTGQAGVFTNVGTAATVSATNTGLGSAATLANNSATDATATVTNNGTGNALDAVSSSGNAVNATATSGRAGSFTNNSGTNPTVAATNNGGANAIDATNTSTGNAIVATAGIGAAGTFSNNSLVTPTMTVSNTTAAGRALQVNGTAGTPNVRLGSVSGASGLAPLLINDGIVVSDVNGDLTKRSAAMIVSNIAWSLTGNGGTNPLVNFLGTTDNVDLAIRTNNTERVRITGAGVVQMNGTGLVTAPTSPATFGANVTINANSTTNGNETVNGNLTQTTGAAQFTGSSFSTGATTPATFGDAVTINDNLTQNVGTAAFNGVALTTSNSTPVNFGTDLTVNGNTGLGLAPIAGYRLAIAGTAGSPNVRAQSLSGAPVATPLSGNEGIIVADNSGDLVKRSGQSVVGGLAWSLIGNAGTTAANYLGTADAQPLSIRTNALERIHITNTGAVTVTGTSFTTLATTPSTFNGSINANGSSFVTSNTTPSIFGGTVTANSIVTANSSIFQNGGIAAFNGVSFSTGATTPATFNDAVTINDNLNVTGTTVTLAPVAGAGSATPLAGNDGIVVADNSGNISKRTPVSVVGGLAWSLTGNAGTTAANFLGTTDAQPLVMRTNGVTRATISAAGSFDVSGPALTTAVATTSTFNGPVVANGSTLTTGASTPATFNGSATFNDPVLVNDNMTHSTGQALFAGSSLVTGGGTASTFNGTVTTNSSLTANNVTTVNAPLTQTAGPAAFNGAILTASATTPVQFGNNLTVGGLTGLGGAPVAGRNLFVAGTGGTSNVRMASLDNNAGIPMAGTDGIVVANNAGDIRRESIGSVVGGAAWLLTGNALTGIERFGSTNAQPVVLVTNNLTRATITAAGSFDVSGTGFSTAATAPATFNGTATFANNVQQNAGTAAFNGTSFSTGGSTPAVLGSNLTVGGTSTLNGITGIGMAPVAGYNLTVNGTGGTPNVRLTSLSANSGTALGAGDGLVVANGSGDLRRESAGSVVGGLAWSLSGNTAGAGDFLGTTNTQNLRIRTNGTDRLVINGTTGSVDVQAGSAFTTSATSPATFGSNVTVNANSTINGNETVNGNLTQNTGGASFNGTGLSTGATTPATFAGTVAANGSSFTTSVGTPSTLNGIVGIGIAPVAGYNLTVADATPGTPNVRLQTLSAAPVAPAFVPATEGIVIADNNGDLTKRTVGSVISTSAWGLTGNAGTDPATNYVGTSDAQGLSIRTNATDRIRVAATGEVGINNTAPGTSQLAVTAAGTNEAGTFAASNGTYTVRATQGGSGMAINAVNNGTGIAANVQISNGVSTANALNVTSNAAGGSNVVNVTNTGGNADLITAGSTSGTGDGLTVAMTGTNTGYAASFSTGNSATGSDVVIVRSNATNTSADAIDARVLTGGGGSVVRAVNEGNGDAINSEVQGTGYAGDFNASNGASGTPTLRVRHAAGAGNGGAALFQNSTAGTTGPTVQITNSGGGRALQVDGTAGTPNVQMASLGGAPSGTALAANDGILVADNSGTIQKYTGASLLSALGIAKGVYNTVAGATTHVITVPAAYNLQAGATVLVTYRDPAAGAVIALEVTTITTGAGGSFTVVSGAGVPAGSQIHWQVLNP